MTWRFPPEVGPWTLRGTSRSADATAWYVPELDLAIDAGAVVFTTRPGRILLTHTHTDHVHMLPMLKSRRKPPRVHLPAHAAPLVERFLLTAQELTDNQPTPPGFVRTPAYTLHPQSPGDRFEIGRGGDRYAVDVIGCDHSVPCLGYLISRLRDKLKPEFVGRPGPELGALRRKGVALTESVETPLVAFLGDTSHRVYDAHPELLRAKVIVGECTFLESEHRERAANTLHTHWDDLAPIIADNPETLFVVTHFSLRYREPEIAAFLAREAPPNVVPWLASTP